MNTKPITIWSRFNYKTETFDHNHIEDGYVDGAFPVPRFPDQKGWPQLKWKREHAQLVNNVVTR